MWTPIHTNVTELFCTRCDMFNDLAGIPLAPYIILLLIPIISAYVLVHWGRWTDGSGRKRVFCVQV